MTDHGGPVRHDGRRWERLPPELFAPLAADRRERYLTVLAAFAAELLEPALNLEAIGRAVSDARPDLADDAVLTPVLTQLVDWGLLEESRDDSVTYRDPAEFRRRTLQWSLTVAGKATLAGLDAAVAELLESAAGLQAAALDRIAGALTDVADLAASPQPDTAAIHLRLAEAESHHKSLVDNLRSFTGQVQRALVRADLTDDELDEVKRAILTYLHRYVVDADLPARRAGDAVRRLLDHGAETVVALAVVGENLAPGLGGEDPTLRATEARRRRFEALVAWFVDRPDEPAHFGQLLPRGRDAILRFLRVLELRRDQRRRAASLPDDLRTLARAAAAAPSRDAAHELWMVATGLHPARHHHLAVDDAEPPAAATGVRRNPPVELTVELRRRPRTAGGTRTEAPLRDDRHLRAARQEREAAALAATLTRRRQLATDGTVRLSSFAALDDEAFADLLDLLGACLSVSPRDDGTRAMTSADGHVEVVLQPVDAHAASHPAAIQGPHGRLVGPDLEVRVTLLGVEVAAGARREPDAGADGNLPAVGSA
ncbi:TIGR02677 family protein [Nitriliruptoraceae bacterium ZYF776]|nr:TIGR02677 family protein [Profundirhabdus halotolerans]